ncbi:MAG: nitric oxide reductase NorD protein [Mycobacterium sp.]|jgi:hypothetical protein|nr:nitric oxide reductase NorD protein [Mycobacterium sp.]
MALAPLRPGEPPWTDGQTIFVDPEMAPRTILGMVAVQSSLVAAGSLDGVVVRALSRARVAERYLAIEGHRALVENSRLLPGVLSALADRAAAGRSDSPAASLAIAAGRDQVEAVPSAFGVIRPKRVLAAAAHAARHSDGEAVGHAPRNQGERELEELDDGEVEDPDSGRDMFSSPVGGAGFIGKWLKRMLSSQRQFDGSGGGPPGADSPTHRTNSANRGNRSVSSTATPGSEDDGADVRVDGVTYPEWDVARRRYRPDWCTVREVEPRVDDSASRIIEDALSMRRPLAPLGMGLHRQRRQAQGDDIDIDAAVEARVELMAGAVPDESVYLDSLRRRRDLSVLLLLDVSGSAAEAGTVGRTVHEQQLTAATSLTVALHDLGDRVALFAYNSQGRRAVNMLAVKRFNDRLDIRVVQRLNGLEPAAYSRLGAAIRHGSAVLEREGGTSRRLLVVISDGLAYDHGYERDYGAADARRALTEARRRGTGCVCLTVGTGLDTAALQRVFGAAAHAAVDRPERLVGVIGPLFRAALRFAEVRRRVV